MDPDENIVVVGTTNSPDFTVTHAYQTRMAQPPFIAISGAKSTGYPNLGGAVDVNAIAASADGSVLYAASSSGIFRSNDGGATWAQQLPGRTSANVLAVDGADSDVLYALGDHPNPANEGHLKTGQRTN